MTEAFSKACGILGDLGGSDEVAIAPSVLLICSSATRAIKSALRGYERLGTQEPLLREGRVVLIDGDPILAEQRRTRS